MKEHIKLSHIIVIIIILIPAILSLFFINKRNSKSGYLIISNIDVLQCNSKSEFIKINPGEIPEEQKKDFIIYMENHKINNSKIDYLNKWNFFDQNGNWINFQENFIAGSKNIDLISKNYEIRNMHESEITLLKKELKKRNILSYSELDQNEVLEFDFNQNKKNEKIIIASNATEYSEDEKLFSIVIGVINNKINILHFDIYDQYENLEVPVYKINNVINLFKNKNDYLILSKGYFSEVGKPTSYIYKVQNNKFESIIKK